MARAILDPGVLVSALISPGGTPARLYLHWLDGAFELVVSPHLLKELDTVHRRPRFPTTPRQVDRYVDFFRRAAAMTPDAPQPWPAVSRDPKDDYLIALARAARVDALVSGDRDLTSLIALTPPILTPAAFRALLGAHTRGPMRSSGQ